VPGPTWPRPLAGLFFDPLPIVARYALAPISIDPNTVIESIDACAAKLVHGAGIKIRVAHLLHAI
jgi:hypothetical protein